MRECKRRMNNISWHAFRQKRVQTVFPCLIIASFIKNNDSKKDGVKTLVERQHWLIKSGYHCCMFDLPTELAPLQYVNSFADLPRVSCRHALGTFSRLDCF